MDDAFTNVMRRYDGFIARGIHQYNVKWAVNTARNRIVFWKNGGSPFGIPQGERFYEGLIRFILCRNQESIEFVPRQVLADYKLTPKPELFISLYD